MPWLGRSARSAVVAVMVLGLGAGCAGSSPKPTDPTESGSSGTAASITGGRAPSNDRMSSTADIGALDKGKVEAEFRAAMPEIDRCLGAGRKRVRYLEGDIELFVRVDEAGKAALANLVRSTLGDHETEACILAAYKARQWPRPIDGKTGEIEHSHQFGIGADADPARPWTADMLAAAMAREVPADAGADAAAPYQALLGALGRCRTEAKADRLEVTMYLDQDGFVQAVGLATDQEGGRGAADCVATVVKTTSFPSPGSSPVKVTVSVR
jgi:hypothetical protein